VLCGRLFAVIDHDEALHQQREVSEAAVAVAGLAIENARLYATMRAQIEQIRTSRLRWPTLPSTSAAASNATCTTARSNDPSLSSSCSTLPATISNSRTNYRFSRPVSQAA